MTIEHRCPNCDAPEMEVFYQLANIPVFSVRLLHSRESALNCPRGELRLAFCRTCGFISNAAFDPSTNPYSSGYEATQSYSPTFDAFARSLAASLVERHDLHGKTIIEIGCGMGEFLVLLAEIGANHGIGFDPAYLPGRVSTPASGRVDFIADFYSEKYAGTPVDALVCRMTLEHIPETREFVRMIRRTIGGRSETLVFFQVPDVTRILEEAAFWDLYYEHCSYFSPFSLTRLFEDSGFRVERISDEYDGQYLLIEARPESGSVSKREQTTAGLNQVMDLVRRFVLLVEDGADGWRRFFTSERTAGRRTALWGGGSKGVAFLTTLGLTHEVDCCVDINPHKAGTYMAGTGQEIILPDQLAARRPDTVVVMNPIYRDEITRLLASLDLNPQLLTVNDIESQPARHLEAR